MRRRSALKYGVLFSGPNGNPLSSFCLDFFLIGVGKSTIGLLSFLNQFAQSRPVLYIPFCKEWLDHSRGQHTNLPRRNLALSYFITRFFTQNADIIEATPPLYDIFRPLFNGKKPNTFLAGMYNALAIQLEAGIVPQCGFILDDSQVHYFVVNALLMMLLSCYLFINCSLASFLSPFRLSTRPCSLADTESAIIILIKRIPLFCSVGSHRICHSSWSSLAIPL